MPGLPDHVDLPDQIPEYVRNEAGQGWDSIRVDRMAVEQPDEQLTIVTYRWDSTDIGQANRRGTVELAERIHESATTVRGYHTNRDEWVVRVEYRESGGGPP